jgi:hypothetical protein
MNFNSQFTTTFEMILVKMVAYNLEFQKIYVNFEGLEVHLLTFFEKK